MNIIDDVGKIAK